MSISLRPVDARTDHGRVKPLVTDRLSERGDVARLGYVERHRLGAELGVKFRERLVVARSGDAPASPHRGTDAQIRGRCRAMRLRSVLFSSFVLLCVGE